jgi:hypothetical protein
MPELREMLLRNQGRNKKGADPETGAFDLA